MSASIAQGKGRVQNLKDAHALLQQALAILDRNKVSPDVGARLQEVIDRVKALDTA